MGKGVVAIDLLHLIDRLESLVTSGVRLPLTSKAFVDEQEFLDIVDQLRVAIPEEIKQAKRLNVESERVIGRAQSEAERIMVAAQEQAAFMLQDNEVLKLSEQRAQAIVDDAQRQAEEVRAGADSYALEVLTGLENELNRLVAQVKRGRATLERAAQVNSPANSPANSPTKDGLEIRPMSPGKLPVRGSSKVGE